MQERRQGSDRRNGDRRVPKGTYSGTERRRPGTDRRQAERRTA
jgi:hypothetical protein